MLTKIPTAEEDQLALIGVTVRDLLWVSAAFDAFRLAVMIPFMAKNPQGALILISCKILLGLVIPFLLWRRGRVRQAAWFMSIAMTGVAAIYMVLSGGIRSSTTVALVAATTMVMILLGRRGVLRLGLPSLAFLAGLTLFQARGGHLPRVFNESYWIFTLNILAGCSVALIPSMRTVGRMAHMARERQSRENHVRAIVDSNPECVKLLDADGLLLEINPAGLAMLEADSAEQVMGGQMARQISPEHRETFLDLNRRVFTGQPFELEHKITGLKGSQRWIETHATPLRDDGGRIVASLCVTRDITARKELEAELRLANAHLLQAQSIGLIGNFTQNLITGEAEYSPEVFRIYGSPGPRAGEEREPWDADFLVTSGAILDGDGDRVRAALFALRARGQEVDITYRLRRADAQVRHVRLKASRELNHKGQPVRTIGVVQDITEHRQVLDRLHRQTAHLELIREEERMRIAREIHDELGQQLTGLKMRAAWAGSLLDSSAGQPHTDRQWSAPARAELAEIGEALESTIRTVRRIATELRPPVLDALGLVPALETLREGFERDHGIECATRFEDVQVSPQIATVVFRVAQEALTNVAKHAAATSVRMSLTEEGSSLILDVEDNGPGLPAAEAPKPAAFGLIGMRERARMLNGRIEFHTPGSGGLRVRLILPHQPSEPSNGTVAHR